MHVYIDILLCVITIVLTVLVAFVSFRYKYMKNSMTIRRVKMSLRTVATKIALRWPDIGKEATRISDVIIVVACWPAGLHWPLGRRVTDNS